jgi:chaperonin GroES
MTELQPVNQNVVLDMNNSGEQKTASGIIIPDTAKEKPKFAKVVWMDNIENSGVKPGDIVYFKPYSGSEIEIENKKYLVIQYADILAKIVETESI